MTTKVRDIISDALLEVGARDPGEALEAGAGADHLRTLNRMIQSWNAEDLMIYTKDRLTFSLIASQQSYTIGVGGNFNTAYPVRPGQIDMVSVLVNSNELPIEILNDEQWRDIVYKPVTSTFPLQMWANGNYPLDTLYFFPTPTAVNSLVLYVWGQTSDFADVNTTVTLPQGYEEAVVLNLAIRLAPGYGRQASPSTIALAKEAKARIKRMNWEPTYREVDQMLSGSLRSIGQKSRGYVIE